MSPAKTSKSLAAYANLNKICAEHLDGHFNMEAIYLVEHLRLSDDDGIVAIPTLVRRLPEPVRKIIGDLSDTRRVLVGLNLQKAN